MKLPRSYSILLLVIVSVVVLPWAAAEMALIIEIPPDVMVTDSELTLGDLGRLAGGTAADRALVANIKLGQAPPPGRVRVLGRDYLQSVIGQYGFSRSLELVMGPQVTIRVEAARITGTAIQKAVEARLGPMPEGIVARWLELRSLPEEIWLDQGEWRVDVESVGEIPVAGTTVFKVTLTNGSESKILNLSGKIRAKAIVYRVVRELPVHTVFSEADFEPVAEELRIGSEIFGTFPIDVRNIMTLRKGQILQKRHYQAVPLVNRGVEVTVIIRNVTFEIKMTGVPRTDGWLNQRIQVMNPESRKIFMGKVIARDTVEVIVR